MARREVTEDDVKQGDFAPFINFFETFTKVGDSFTGICMGSRSAADTDYYDFKQRNGEVGTLSVKGPLKSQLAKAKPVKGEKVTISVKGKRDAYFIFSVVVDDAPAPKSKPPPPPSEDDDTSNW